MDKISSFHDLSFHQFKRRNEFRLDLCATIKSLRLSHQIGIYSENKPTTQLFQLFCAQCFPRHACPLYASLLMHLHASPHTAPAVGRRAISEPVWIMRNHAPTCVLLQHQKSHLNGGLVAALKLPGDHSAWQ